MYRKAAETGASHPAAWETSGHHRGVMAWLRLESRSGDIPWGRRQRCCGRVHCLPPWCGNLLDSWSMFPDGRVPCRATWSTVPAGHVPVRHREASRFRGVKACRAARRDGVPRGLRGVPRAPCRVRRWTRQDMPGKAAASGEGAHCTGASGMGEATADAVADAGGDSGCSPQGVPGVALPSRQRSISGVQSA